MATHTVCEIIERRSALANGPLDTPCAIWTGARTRKGYSAIKRFGKTVEVHRAAWIEIHGPLPYTQKVCHKCDNPRCVNIAHLFVGSNRDNAMDAKAKGRLAAGERNGQSKLNAWQVRVIRAVVRHPRKFYGWRTHLSRLFGISANALDKVVSGKTWN